MSSPAAGEKKPLQTGRRQLPIGLRPLANAAVASGEEPSINRRPISSSPAREERLCMVRVDRLDPSPTGSIDHGVATAGRRGMKPAGAKCAVT